MARFDHIRNPVTRKLLERLELLRAKYGLERAIKEYESLEYYFLSVLEGINNTNTTNITVAASVSALISSGSLLYENRKDEMPHESILRILSIAMPPFLATLATKAGIESVVPTMLKDIRSYAVELHLELNETFTEPQPDKFCKIEKLIKYAQVADTPSKNNLLAFLALRCECNALLYKIHANCKQVDISMYYPFLTLSPEQLQQAIDIGFEITPSEISYEDLKKTIFSDKWKIINSDTSELHQKLLLYYTYLQDKGAKGTDISKTLVNYLLEMSIVHNDPDCEESNCPFKLVTLVRQYYNNELPTLLIHAKRSPLDIISADDFCTFSAHDIIESFPRSLVDISHTHIYKACFSVARYAFEQYTIRDRDNSIHLECCKTLIEREGFDINNLTAENQTILSFALKSLPFNGDYDFIKYLISRGADVNKKSDKSTDGNIDIIILKSGSDKILHLLADNGATIDIPTSYLPDTLEGTETNTLETILKCVHQEPIQFSTDMGIEEFGIRFMALPVKLREFLSPYLQKGFFKLVINSLHQAMQFEYPILNEFKNYDATTIATYIQHHVPEHLTCAISHDQLIDPVRIEGDVSNTVYERNVIKRWLDSRSSSQLLYPSTQLPIKGQVTYIPLSKNEIKDMVNELHEALDKVQQELKEGKIPKKSPKHKP